MLKEVSGIEKLHFITNYNSNVVLECGGTNITGNVVGEHLIKQNSLPNCPENYCQWKYLAKLYDLPYHTCITLLGNPEQNWVNFGGYHPNLNILKAYWLGEGFKVMKGGPQDFHLQTHNIRKYLNYDYKDELNLIIRETLFETREQNLRNQFQDRPEVATYL
jgi:hypothetical protein